MVDLSIMEQLEPQTRVMLFELFPLSENYFDHEYVPMATSVNV